MDDTQRDRLKYLLKAILDVDVDAIAGRVVASLAVRQSETAAWVSAYWKAFDDGVDRLSVNLMRARRA